MGAFVTVGVGVKAFAATLGVVVGTLVAEVGDGVGASAVAVGLGPRTGGAGEDAVAYRVGSRATS